jgi:O-methyltransferase involved in polyketide biosynthesis
MVTNLEQTAFETLLARAEAGHKHSQDNVSLLKRLGIVTREQKFSDTTAYIRYSIILAKLAAFTRANPEAAILNLACGLANYPEEGALAHFRGTWLDVDLPGIMDVRAQLPFTRPERSDYCAITGDLTKVRRHVNKTGDYVFNIGTLQSYSYCPDLVIAEGIFMYLSSLTAASLIGKRCLFDVVGDRRVTRNLNHRWLYSSDMEKDKIFGKRHKITDRAMFTEKARDGWLLETMENRNV